MNRILLLLTLLVQIGCLPSFDKELNEFELNTYKSLITTRNVDFILKKNLNQADALVAPVHTWMTLAKFRAWTIGAEEFREFCLHFRTPSKNKLGRLRLTKGKNCAERFSTNVVSDLQNIKIFSFYYSNNELNLKFSRNKDMLSLVFPLQNVREKKSFEKFKSYSENSLWVLSSERKKGSPYPSKIGNFADDYAEKTAVKCHEVTKDCETKLEFECSRCRYGWYEVVANNCPGGSTKYCGINRCGQKGQPACLRGHEQVDIKNGQLNCESGSKAGFCQKGLKTFCHDGMLICL